MGHWANFYFRASKWFTDRIACAFFNRILKNIGSNLLFHSKLTQWCKKSPFFHFWKSLLSPSVPLKSRNVATTIDLIIFSLPNRNKTTCTGNNIVFDIFTLRFSVSLTRFYTVWLSQNRRNISVVIHTRDGERETLRD